MTPLELAGRLGAALGLGLLVGLERQHTQRPEGESFAGARTFALIALLAAAAFDVGTRLGHPWLPLASFAAVAALAVVSYYVTSQQGDVGATTEVSALLTFVIGGLCGADQVGLAAAIAVATLLLLSLKGWTQRFAQRIEAADVEAALKFAVITVIVLPLLPNRNFGPDAARRRQPIQGLADGRADLGPQLRELRAREGGGPGARHRDHGTARGPRLQHRGDARLLAAQPTGAGHSRAPSRSGSSSPGR